MYRKEVNAQSPLRILEHSIHGGLGAGNLGLVMSPPGVGKTAALVHIGLDDLMRERDVLHVALGQTLKHVSTFYDAIFDEIARETALDGAEAVRESLGRRRAIKCYAESHAFTPGQLEQAVEFATKHMSLQPTAILIDGFDWAGKNLAADVAGLKAIAKRLGAELWATIETPRGYVPNGSNRMPPTLDAVAAAVDVALFLETRGSRVLLRLVKDHGDARAPETHLELHPDTLHIVPEGTALAPKALPAESYTLLSGGAPGAESEFGACAEKWKLGEETFSFAGRKTEHTRGLIELSEEELMRGDVSDSYLKSHMHRSYPQTPLFKSVLRSIWHEVSTAGEVFAVGVVMPDGTFNGGTGWAVELAKHWHKPVNVFDQEKKAWFGWQNGKWVLVDAPRVTRARFTGTGTRFLTDDGRNAIRGLFERSFGSARK
jgi:hypothetical protein